MKSTPAHQLPCWLPQTSSSFPGGFIFKQWKKQFLHLTAEGKLLLCHDALSLPHQMIQLQSNCEAIVQGKEILDLPKLPSGASRDCCFALILPQNKYLLLLAETSSDCWSDYISLLLRLIQPHFLPIL
uniref:PH domain-containing protein n=1 Tax=Oryzias latipes TaxID=8090 RepID=A0A3P9LX48_ORYLA